MRFNQLRGIVLDEDSSIYVNDHENNCVRQVAQMTVWSRRWRATGSKEQAWWMGWD